MHEAILDLSKAHWSPQKEVVRVFYKEMWDHADTSLVPQIFHPDFTFRGSLGPQLVGHEEFIGYVRFVTGALEHYTSDILALGEEGNQVFGKLRFHGYHRGELFDVQPSGRHVWWYGTPIFTFDGNLVRDLWVLGDIHGLIGRLQGAPGAQDASGQ
ncbi:MULTISPECIES: ester cyclase [Ramlibacter]|uniref:Ester cyclase n=1 Tax=Ramlibacter pinisoli TaxID=2682844 RepID=A0A6N8ITR6_9BURK|nr:MULTISPECIES: ester cyclase [Ramlibacter]MBA2964337.1 ester cyclase [Ramlibacter sp. CGMCC 1.13660]MVQ29303.1 ester cyclase [Ramlibacter pinisoli]